VAAGCGSRILRGGEPGVFGKGRDKGILAKAAMVGAARLRVAGRISRHAGADGIEFDMAVAWHVIASAVDQARFVAAFSQGPRTTVASVELAEVAASKVCCMKRATAPSCGGVASRCTWLSINTYACNLQPVSSNASRSSVR
jgi:hypothetical protein